MQDNRHGKLFDQLLLIRQFAMERKFFGLIISSDAIISGAAVVNSEVDL